MPARITVIGSSNVDFVTRVPRLPAPGETVGGGRFAQVFGGKGANTAVAVARLRDTDQQAAFITALGNDPFASIMLDNFTRDGLDTSMSVRVADLASGTALIVVDDAGRNIIAVAPGANDRVTPGVIDGAEELIRASRLVVMQMEIPPATVNHVLSRCRAWGVPTLLNYAPVREREVPIDSRIGTLVVNEHEANELGAGTIETVEDAIHAAKELRKRGPATVVITLGGDGAVASSEEGEHHAEAPKVKAVDTVAAGDTFCGALAVSLVGGKALDDAMRFATKAASISVTREGAQPSIPRRGELG
jgi:ribokinase